MTHPPTFSSSYLPTYIILTSTYPTQAHTNPQVHTSTNLPNQPAAFHTSILLLITGYLTTYRLYLTPHPHTLHSSTLSPTHSPAPTHLPTYALMHLPWLSLCLYANQSDSLFACLVNRTENDWKRHFSCPKSKQSHHIKLLLLLLLLLSHSHATQVSERSNVGYSSLLKGISWSQRVSNLVGQSFCKYLPTQKLNLCQLVCSLPQLHFSPFRWIVCDYMLFGPFRSFSVLFGPISVLFGVYTYPFLLYTLSQMFRWQTRQHWYWE